MPTAEQEALPYLARAALLQARIAANLGDTTSAKYLCHQALDIAQGQGLLDLEYRCDYLLGQIAEHHDNLDEATSYYDRAMKGIDIVQSHLVMDERSSFLEDKGGVYKRAVNLALKRGSYEQALIYVEKAKSRVLGDYLRNNIDIRMRAGDKAGEAILEDLSRLREEQAWFSNIVYEAEHESGLSDTALMRIQSIEVFNLDLSACTLVTLSACETGRGIVGGVDEVIGLGRGFLYAGSASLMPTLWKVDDASSAELMEMYYQALLSDYGKAAALAGAQRAYLARARTSIVPYRVHPYFWGGFHLIGDPGPI